MARRRSSSRAAYGLAAAATLFTFTQPTCAHSWVEQLQRVASNGTMINPAGFIRDYTGHADPGFSDSDDVYLLPPNGRSNGKVFATTDNICAPQQKIGAYSSKYPKLTTAPGDLIALRHQENGHVTLPQNQANKPLNRGTIYIYGTEKPTNNDTLLAIHKVWNTAGTGGDGRGKLLATRNYDDDQCYQVNSGTISQQRQEAFSKIAAAPQGVDLWCQSDLRLPSDITVGTDYTLYWVWDWPTLVNNQDPNSAVATPEIYTSCMDLSIVDPCDASLGSVKSPQCSTASSSVAASSKANSLISSISNSFSKGQDLGNAAILSQLTSNFAVAVNGSNSSSSSSSSSGSGSGSDSGSNNAGSASSAAAPAASSAAVAAPQVSSVVGTTLYTSTRSRHHTAPGNTDSAAPAQNTNAVVPVIVASETATVTVTDQVVTVYATTVTVQPSSAATTTAAGAGSTSTSSVALTTTLPATTMVVSTVQTAVVTVPTPGVAPQVSPFKMAKRIRGGNARILGD